MKKVLQESVTIAPDSLDQSPHLLVIAVFPASKPSSITAIHLPRCVLPSAAKHCSNALPPSSDDQPSAKSRLRVALASLTSSSLRSRHGRSTGSFLRFWRSLGVPEFPE